MSHWFREISIKGYPSRYDLECAEALVRQQAELTRERRFVSDDGVEYAFRTHVYAEPGVRIVTDA